MHHHHLAFDHTLHDARRARLGGRDRGNRLRNRRWPAFGALRWLVSAEHGLAGDVEARGYRAHDDDCEKLLYPRASTLAQKHEPTIYDRPMPRPQAPVLDLLITRDGDAWRLHVAPFSWTGGVLRERMDGRREIFPVSNPGAEDLHKFMFESDSPYEGGATADGGLQIRAKGRSAVTLLVWLEGIVRH